MVASTLVVVPITSLLSSSAYVLRYFCVGNTGTVSTEQNSAFAIASNGGYLMKIVTYFD